MLSSLCSSLSISEREVTGMDKGMIHSQTEMSQVGSSYFSEGVQLKIRNCLLLELFTVFFRPCLAMKS